MRRFFFGTRLACVTLLLAMAPGLALAYIDPGSGAYMVQALFALVGAVLFYIRHPIRSIRALADRVFRKTIASQSSNAEVSEDSTLQQNSLEQSRHKEKNVA